MPNTWPNPVIMIVGGSRGIGLELVSQYAARGAQVHATFRVAPTPALQELAKSKSNVHLHALDVCNQTQLSRLVSEVDKLAVETVIHSAGVNAGPSTLQHAINAEAPFSVVKALLPAMLRTRSETRRVVCILTSDLGTSAALRNFPVGTRLHPYVLSKLAANDRFREIEPTWRTSGVIAVAMQPGFVATDMNGGKGKITAAASAKGIRAVLESLPMTRAGSFVDYLGRSLDWQTGKPVHRARRPRREASELLTSPSSATWTPLESDSASGLLAINPDPLGALSRGEVPAVIIRGALPDRERQQVLERLVGQEMSKARKYWIRTRSPLPPHHVTYADFGANLAAHLNKGKTPAEYTSSVARAMHLYDRHDLQRPIHVLHESLRSIRADRHRVSTAVDQGTNRSFGPGIFRQHLNGGSFALHLDSLRAHLFSHRECSGTEYRRGSDGETPAAAAYEDVYRFERQLAALLLLQRSELPGAELSVYDYDVDRLLNDCTVHVQPSAHNVHVVNGSAQLLGPLSAQRASHLHIDAGDFYVINVNRLHVVHPVYGTKSRVSLGSFVGHSSSELKIWS